MEKRLVSLSESRNEPNSRIILFSVLGYLTKRKMSDKHRGKTQIKGMCFN